MMKRLLAGCLFSISVTTLNAQTVSIPDANFKNALLGDPSINTNGDTEIQVSEAQAFNGNMSINAMNISSLTGLEAFTSLKGLFCNGNPLNGNLDISHNVALNYLQCQMIQLTALDVSNNVALLELDCAHNQLTTINLMNNSALTRLDCMFNQVTQLDVSPCTFLENLNVGTNPLQVLDVSTNAYLKGVNCTATQLTSLDLSNNPQVYGVSCFNNPSLEELNLAHGNQANYQQILAYNNPNLTCIQVDNIAYSIANWSDGVYFDFDPQHTFDTDCFTTTTGVSENDLLSKIQLYPNPVAETIYLNGELSGIHEIKLCDLNGKQLKTWTNSFQQLTVSDVKAGTYLLQFYGNEGTNEVRTLIVR